MKKSLEAEQIDSLEVVGLGKVSKGSKVRHPLFGAGEVVALFAFPNGDHSIGVEFKSHGYKALAPQYCGFNRSTQRLGEIVERAFRS